MLPRWPKILTSYAKLPKLQNLVHLNNCPLIVLTCCHAVTMSLTPTTTFMTAAAPWNAAAHPAALAIICAAVTITMILGTANDPFVLVLTATMLTLKMSIPLENSTLTSWDMTLLVYQANLLKSHHILMALIILSSTLIQMATLTIMFILPVMEIVKTALLLLIQKLIQIMNPKKHFILTENPQQTCLLLLTFKSTPILRPWNTAIGFTLNLTNSPQLG